MPIVSYWLVFLAVAVLIAWLAAWGSSARVLRGIDLRNIEGILAEITSNGEVKVEKWLDQNDEPLGWIIWISHGRLVQLYQILERGYEIKIKIWPSRYGAVPVEFESLYTSGYPREMGAGEGSKLLAVAGSVGYPERGQALPIFRRGAAEEGVAEHSMLALMVPWRKAPTDNDFRRGRIDFAVHGLGSPIHMDIRDPSIVVLREETMWPSSRGEKVA